MPHRTPKTTATLSQALQDGERVLWSECNGHGGKDSLSLGIFCAIGFSAFYGLLVYWAHADGSISPALLKVLEIFIVFALLSLVCGFYYAAAEKRRLYALTNRRALIITPRPLAKPLLCAIPLTANIIFNVKQNADLTSDNLMYSTRYNARHGSNLEDKDGFRHIIDTTGLENTLHHLGIALPQPGNPRPIAFRKKPLFTPAAKTLLLAAGFYTLSGVLLPAILHATGADLYLFGERTTATIIGSKRHTKQKRANVTVSGTDTLTKHEATLNHTDTRHYPILRYQDSALGTVRVTDKHGDDSPDWSYGQQVDVLYTPGDTTRILRDTQNTRTNAYLYTGISALALLWLLWECAKTIRQARRTRHLPYLTEPITPESPP